MPLGDAFRNPLMAFGAGLMSGGVPAPVEQGLGAGIQAGLGNAMQMAQWQAQQGQQERQNTLGMLQLRQAMEEQKQRRAQQQAMQQSMAGLPEEDRLMAQLAPEKFVGAMVENRFKTPEPPKTREIKKQGEIITQQWNPRTMKYEEIARTSQYKPEPPPGVTEATGALKTREGKVRDYMDLFGLSRQEATLRVDNGFDVIPTSDGRLVERHPITGEVKDVTPEVSGYDPVEEPEGQPVTGDTVSSGVGPGPRTSALIATVAGGFMPSATSEETERAQQQLRLLERMARSAFTISSRPSAWEQSLIKELFADPDRFFESPARAAINLQEVKKETTRLHNDVAEMLSDPAIQGSQRAELIGKKRELERLVNAIDVSDQDVRRLLGEEPAARQGQMGELSPDRLSQMSLEEIVTVDPSRLTPEQRQALSRRLEELGY